MARKLRSETISVRLDPKLRYLAELGARKHRRTLSSFVEWSVEECLKRLVIGNEYGQPVTLSEKSAELWDVEDADRFAKLAFKYPDLMTHTEQVAWKLIREEGYFWKGHQDQEGEWIYNSDKESSLVLERVRDRWQTINAVARGEIPKSQLVSADLDMPAAPTDDEETTF